jgi:DNA-binding NtrC family response regulator
MLNREGQARSLSVDAIEYLKELTWPGNVRELRNVMRRAAALATGVVIDRQLLQSLEEVTAEITLPEGFDPSYSSEEGVSITPRHSWSSRGESIRTISAGSDPACSSQPSYDVRLSDADRLALLSGASRHDFDLSLEEAIEALRAAYIRELRRRFGEDVNGAAAHAGVHPKSVSRFYRLYRLS